MLLLYFFLIVVRYALERPSLRPGFVELEVGWEIAVLTEMLAILLGARACVGGK